MQTKTLFITLPVCFLALCLFLGAITPYAVADDDDESAQVLRHVVLFKFKDDATAEQVRAIEAAFCRLPSATGVIQDLEWGTNVSPENLDQGYTHLFFLTFKNEADRDTYLPHPAHKEFGAMLGPVLDKVAVFDYWTKP